VFLKVRVHTRVAGGGDAWVKGVEKENQKKGVRVGGQLITKIRGGRGAVVAGERIERNGKD